ncbi:hypothetical protein GY45DRAFT_1327665 [Cubamyces sp. BRFM 1775]|nr:hypothetical protein GY45DRAFT_1327665 [Cubamyces sp. BRFM 1775]
MGTSRSTLPVHITSTHDHPATVTASSSQSQIPHMNTNPNRTSRVFANRVPRIPQPVNPLALSPDSDDGVPDRLWFSQDFMLGAGMVIIQPTTGKIVLLREGYTDPRDTTKIIYSWFLPKGRKDRDESLEQTALREAYEESGLRVSFLPLLIPNHAPLPPDLHPDVYYLPCHEPICINLHKWAKKRNNPNDYGGEYLTHWYVGQIPDDARVEQGTRMDDELGYETCLVTLEQALGLLRPGSILARIVRKAYALWLETRERLGSPEWQKFLAEMGHDLTSLGLGPALGPVLASRERQARASASAASLSASSSRSRNRTRAGSL